MKGLQVVRITLLKNGMEAVVRHAAVDDHEAILYVVRDRQRFREIREGEPAREFTPEQHAVWRERLCRPNFITLVACIGGKIQGYIEVGLHEKCGLDVVLVYSLTVVGKHRGKGIGRILLESAIKEAQESLGAKAIELWTTVQNTHAVALYKSVGFKELKVLPGETTWNRQPADRIHMAKNL